LPARLPRGRGDDHVCEAQAAPQGGSGGDARARRRRLVDHRRALRLLHDEGPARDLRRALPSLCRPSRGGTLMTPLPVSIAAAVASFPLLAIAFRLIREQRIT